MKIENPPKSVQDSQEQEVSNDRLSPKEILENDLRKLESQRQELRANGRNTVKMDAELEQLTQKWETAENTVALSSPEEMGATIADDLRKLEVEREQLRGYDGRDTGKIDTELELLTQKLDRVRSAIAAKNAEQGTDNQEVGESEEVNTNTDISNIAGTAQNVVDEGVELPTNTGLERSGDIAQNAGTGSVSAYELNTQNSAKSTLPVFGAAAAASLNQLPQDQGTKIKGVDLPPKPKGVDTGAVQTAPEDFQARYDREVLARKKEYQNLSTYEVAAKHQEITRGLEGRISFFAAREKIRKDEFADQKPSEMNAKELRKFNDRMYKLEQDIAQNGADSTAKAVNVPPTAQTELIATLSETQDTKKGFIQEKIRKYWKGLSKTDKILWPTLVAGLLGSGALAYNSLYNSDTVSSSTNKKSVEGGKIAQNKLKDLGVVMAGSDKDSELTLAMLSDSNSTERDLKLEKEAQKAVDLSTKTLEMMEKKESAVSNMDTKQEMSQVDRANELAAQMGIKNAEKIKYQNGVATQIDGQMVNPGLYTKEEIKMIQGVHSDEDRASKSAQKQIEEQVKSDLRDKVKALETAASPAGDEWVVGADGTMTKQISGVIKGSEVQNVSVDSVSVEVAPKKDAKIDWSKKKINWHKLPEKELNSNERAMALLAYIKELDTLNGRSKNTQLLGNDFDIDPDGAIRKIDGWEVPKELWYFKLPKSQESKTGSKTDSAQEIITPMEQGEVVTPAEIGRGKFVSMDTLMSNEYQARLDEVQETAQNMGIPAQDVENVLFGDDEAKTILEINGRSV